MASSTSARRQSSRLASHQQTPTISELPKRGRSTRACVANGTPVSAKKKNGELVTNPRHFFISNQTNKVESYADEDGSDDNEEELDESQRVEMDVSELSDNGDYGEMENGTTINLGELEDALEAVADQYFGRKSKKRRDSLDDSDDCDADEQKKKNIQIPLPKIKEWIEIADQMLPEAVHETIEGYSKDFSTWMTYLCADFNLVLYGFGTKRVLLEDFREKCLGEFDCLTVEGYRPTITIRTVLTSLALHRKLISSNSAKALGPVEWANSIRKELEEDENGDDVILIVHNIDGPALRDSQSQAALSVLATCDRIHIVASIDHVNASLMWDRKTLSRFRWVWLETPTLLSYSVELFAGDSKLLGLSHKSGGVAHTVASLDRIWQSLTDNARKVLARLAELASKRNVLKDPISIWELYRVCRDDFLVTSEAVLKQQLVEFEDHRLITGKRLPDGTEALMLTVDMPVLLDFLKQNGHDLSGD
uniref:Origin recognition complex subunit 2 n=1 Tax=Plectus sambesii TaxID=2011161 RepID=A0A914UR93_9BILA